MADIEYLTVEHLSTKDLIRIFSKISIDPAIQWNGTPCWIWTAAKHGDYGAVRGPAPDSHYERTHRLMFAWLVHPLIRRYRHEQIDHLCRRKLCCNPVHLEYVTAQINSRRSDSPPSLNAQKTHCKRGHRFSRVRIVNGDAERYCGQCAKIQSRKRYQLNRERCRQTSRDWRSRNLELVRARDREAQRKQRERLRAIKELPSDTEL